MQTLSRLLKASNLAEQPPWIEVRIKYAHHRLSHIRSRDASIVFNRDLERFPFFDDFSCGDRRLKFCPQSYVLPRGERLIRSSRVALKIQVHNSGMILVSRQLPPMCGTWPVMYGRMNRQNEHVAHHVEVAISSREAEVRATKIKRLAVVCCVVVFLLALALIVH